MRFDPPLVSATLVQRYKRFFADVRTDAGELLTVHFKLPKDRLFATIFRGDAAVMRRRQAGR